VLSEQEILKREKEFKQACYLLWLERPTDPLDISPAKNRAEELFIGQYIKKIKSLNRWFKRNELPIPVFDPDNVQ
jgi:hypothetical protein